MFKENIRMMKSFLQLKNYFKTLIKKKEITTVFGKVKFIKTSQYFQIRLSIQEESRFS